MKRILSLSVAMLSMTMLLSSCNCFKTASKRTDEITGSVNPKVLALKGDKVPFDYEINVPEKFVAKKAVVKITPVLVSGENEQFGTTQFIQGTSVKDNYRVIAKTGELLKYSDAFNFDAENIDTNLEFRFEIKCKESGEFAEVYRMVAAKGISQVQNMLAVASCEGLKTSEDNFQRVTVETKDANIMFQINRANVRRSQLNSDEIAELEKFIADNRNADRRTLGNLYSKSYASPDGALDFNEKLAKNRSKSTKKSMERRIKKNESLKGIGFDVDALGEDWDGFKALVEASDIPDKNLVLDVLGMYSDPEKRDEEIANLTSVFEILKEKILPELRRSKLSVDVEVQGYTDEELKELVASDINKLNLEEMLFSATLFNDFSTKIKIYTAATQKYADDFRAWNNLGKYQAITGDAKGAGMSINKAAELNANSSDVVNNLGVVAMMEGRYDDARKYFESVNTKESKYNVSVLAVLEGNYEKATGLVGYNKAVVEVLTGDLTSAKAELAKLSCPRSKALSAVVESRLGNVEEANKMIEELKQSDAANLEFVAMAEREVAFAK